MKNRLIAAAITLLFFFASEGYSQNVALNVKASTLGAGLEVEGVLFDSLGARLGVNYLSYDYSGTEDDIEYNFDLSLETLSLLLDWHPFQGPFRISGGGIYNNNHLDLKAKSSTTYEIGNTTYTATQIGMLDGEIDFNDIAPYLGLGWDTSFGKKNRIGFLFELGVMYQDSPDVDLSVSGSVSSDQAFLNDLAKEEKNLQDDLDSFKYYPVIAVGLNYRF